MKPPKLHPDDVERIAELRAHNWTYERIAEEIGRSTGCVEYHCLQEGIEPDRPPRSTPRAPGTYFRNGLPVRCFTPEEDELLLDLARQGRKPAEIARQLKRKPHSVSARLMILARREERALWWKDAA